MENGKAKFAIVTCSDTRSIAEDTAGAALEELIATQGWVCASRVVVKDERDRIAAAIVEAAEMPGIDVVLTCGGSTGDAAGQLNKLLKKKGMTLSAQFAVPMVDNYIPLSKLDPPEKIEKILNDAEEYIDEARRAIRSMGFGDYNRCQGITPVAKTATVYRAYARGRSTKPFLVTDACTGCGECRQQCPCGAIELQEGKPVWVKPQCVQCLGCLHRCPAEAIHWKKASEKNGRYYNPRAKDE